MKKNIGMLLLGICIFIIKVDAKNINIIKAYQYDQENSNSLCITGDEATCIETTCYQDSKEQCPSGTIIDYQVNKEKVIRFHVMFDESGKITMQSQKNIINNTPWASKEDYIASGGLESDYGIFGNHNKGPVTALPAIEATTRDWIYVEDQTYTLGTTIFKTNAYTGCDYYDNCNKNDYTLDSKIAKARMITLQEATLLGCRMGQIQCPIWMFNYLKDSTKYGGTNNDLEADSYSTLTSNSSYDPAFWYIYDRGYFTYDNAYSVSYPRGVRAVVVVNKNLENQEMTNQKREKNNQIVAVKDTFRNAYIGYCLGTVILVFGIMVSYQYVRKDQKEIKIKGK